MPCQVIPQGPERGSVLRRTLSPHGIQRPTMPSLREVLQMPLCTHSPPPPLFLDHNDLNDKSICGVETGRKLGRDPAQHHVEGGQAIMGVHVVEGDARQPEYVPQPRLQALSACAFLDCGRDQFGHT